MYVGFYVFFWLILFGC